MEQNVCTYGGAHADTHTHTTTGEAILPSLGSFPFTYDIRVTFPFWLNPLITDVC